MNAGITPFLLNNFNISTKPNSFLLVEIGVSIIPIQFPFTNIFELFARYSGVHSKLIFIGVFALNHLIIGIEDDPLVIYALIDKCLCNPMLPPSGVSNGSINPHWELFNRRGPTTFALASRGKFILRK